MTPGMRRGRDTAALDEGLSLWDTKGEMGARPGTQTCLLPQRVTPSLIQTEPYPEKWAVSRDTPAPQPTPWLPQGPVQASVGLHMYTFPPLVIGSQSQASFH